MEMLEPCKVVVFGGIKEFRLKLKSLGISEIKNDNQFIKESDVVLILIEEIDGKFVAENITSLSIFNRIDTKMAIGSEIKDIVYINKQNIQCTEDFKFDFKFDPNKIYYVKAFDEGENEFWLF